MRVPYIDLTLQHRTIREELLMAVEQVLDHGQFILGPEVEAFEERFADYCGTRYAVGVDNGTSALFLIMCALGIGDGDEVITVPNSFLASASSIALTGAKPVFVDVCEDYNMNPSLLSKAITPRTRAILPVHLTGRPADMYPIMEIAEHHGLYVIEDCAQAVGAQYYNQRVGSFGIAGCFSLHPLKNLNAVGDGGVVTTDNQDLYETLLMARNHGLRNRNECEFWSHNCRLDTIQAVMLLVKMNYLDEWNKSRRENAAYYQACLPHDVVGVPGDKQYEHAVYHTFMIQADRRNDLQRHLAQRGVGTAVHYPIPIHLQKPLGYPVGSFPVTEQQAKRILSLPIYPELVHRQLEYVVSSVWEFYNAS